MPFSDGSLTLFEKGAQDFLHGIRWKCLKHPDNFVCPNKQKLGKRTGCSKCIKTAPSQTYERRNELRQVRDREAGILPPPDSKELYSCFQRELFNRLGLSFNPENYAWLHRVSFSGLTTPCSDCGVWIGGHRRCGICSKALRYRHDCSRKGGAQERCKKYGVPYESFNELLILERDNWTCKICGKPTPKAKRGTYDDDAPEIDHIWALSATKNGLKGPGHTPSNCRCACRKCNLKRGNKFIDDSTPSDASQIPINTDGLKYGQEVGRNFGLFWREFWTHIPEYHLSNSEKQWLKLKPTIHGRF